MKFVLTLAIAILFTGLASAQQDTAPAKEKKETTDTKAKTKLDKPLKDKSGKEVDKAPGKGKPADAKQKSNNGKTYGKHKGDMKGKEHGKNRAEQAHQKKGAKSEMKTNKKEVKVEKKAAKEAEKSKKKSAKKQKPSTEDNSNEQ